ncbi:MAG: DUF1801 domain-containing protein [Pyrinomonadaceae bacterium]|nr:DUF1801 domain-containing protein [Pyrinomonadaceae bacterium]
MKKMQAAASPNDYVASLSGWQLKAVKKLRTAVRSAGSLEETIKWGHLVYICNGPVLLIRAEDERVLFGFWRGKHLTQIEQRLKPSGKYNMATLILHESTRLTREVAMRLAEEAIRLNKELGDPTKVPKR